VDLLDNGNRNYDDERSRNIDDSMEVPSSVLVRFPTSQTSDLIEPSKDPINLEQLSQYGLDGTLEGSAHFARYKGRQVKRAFGVRFSTHLDQSEGAQMANDRMIDALLNNPNNAEEDEDEAAADNRDVIKPSDTIEPTKNIVIDRPTSVASLVEPEASAWSPSNDAKGVQLRAYVTKVLDKLLTNANDNDERADGLFNEAEPNAIGETDQQLNSRLLASLLPSKKLDQKKPGPVDVRLKQLTEDEAELAASVKRAQGGSSSNVDATAQLLQKDNRPVEEGQVHVELDSSGKHVQHVSPTTVGEQTSFAAVDSSYAFVYVQWNSAANRQRVQRQKWQEIVNWIERQLQLPRGSFSNVQIKPLSKQVDKQQLIRVPRPIVNELVYAITFKVNPNKHELDAHDVSILIGECAFLQDKFLTDFCSFSLSKW
jgi:hypothetical protein